MLNSAAGVMLPSAAAPPIETIRSTLAPPVRSSSKRDVGQRAGRHERDGLRAGCDRPLHEVDRVLAERLVPRRRQRRAVEAAVAVDVRCDHQLPLERTIRAGRDRDVGATDEVEHAQRIRRRLLERLVAVDGGDPEQLDLRAREREEQRDRVVVPGIAVEDDRNAHARSIAVVAAATFVLNQHKVLRRRGSGRSRRRSAATAARRAGRRRARRQRRRGSAPRPGRGPRAARRAGTP